MRITRHSPNDDANNRVASYESLLDLFTLLSFILIIASFFYVARTTGQNQNASLVTVLEAQHESGIPQALPNDLLLLVIFRENSSDKIGIEDGTTGISTNLDVTVHGIDNTLDRFASVFARVNKIDVAMYTDKEDANPGILVAVQHWLFTHEHKNYRLYFAGNQ
jgi:hypothetical protein